jgi:hypothetical protein
MLEIHYGGSWAKGVGREQNAVGPVADEEDENAPIRFLGQGTRQMLGRQQAWTSGTCHTCSHRDRDGNRQTERQTRIGHQSHSTSAVCLSKKHLWPTGADQPASTWCSLLDTMVRSLSPAWEAIWDAAVQ